MTVESFENDRRETMKSSKLYGLDHCRIPTTQHFQKILRNRKILQSLNLETG